MIKVFITVGTTPFDELIRYCDLNLDPDKFKCTAQVSEYSSYVPKNLEAFPFVKDISTYLKSADLVISHAGAGNVYSILENHFKAIFVPNHTLKDGHQEDICRFIEKNHYASVYRLNSDESLNEKIGYTIIEKFQIYSNDKTNDLIHSIYQILKNTGV
jgi:beta-1,4-N-acetylglucosaminyltransferase